MLRIFKLWVIYNRFAGVISENFPLGTFSFEANAQEISLGKPLEQQYVEQP